MMVLCVIVEFFEVTGSKFRECFHSKVFVEDVVTIEHHLFIFRRVIDWKDCRIEMFLFFGWSP